MSEALALYQMAWALIGLPLLIGVNVGAAYIVWAWIEGQEQ